MQDSSKSKSYGVSGVSRSEDVLSGLVGDDLSLEVGVVDVLWNLDSRNVNLERGGDDERLSDSAEWESVDLVWSCKSQSFLMIDLENYGNNFEFQTFFLIVGNAWHSPDTGNVKKSNTASLYYFAPKLYGTIQQENPSLFDANIQISKELTGDQEKSGLWELLEEDHTLSLMTSSKNDQDGSWGEGLAKGDFLGMSKDELGSVSLESWQLGALQLNQWVEVYEIIKFHFWFLKHIVWEWGEGGERRSKPYLHNTTNFIFE